MKIEDYNPDDYPERYLDTDDDPPFFKCAPSGRVLVHLIDAPRRPFISFYGCLDLHRPADWGDIGFEEWEAEHERRRKLHDLMTDDERNIFNEYCRLRDD